MYHIILTYNLSQSFATSSINFIPNHSCCCIKTLNYSCSIYETYFCYAKFCVIDLLIILLYCYRKLYKTQWDYLWSNHFINLKSLLNLQFQIFRIKARSTLSYPTIHSLLQIYLVRRIWYGSTLTYTLVNCRLRRNDTYVNLNFAYIYNI